MSALCQKRTSIEALFIRNEAVVVVGARLASRLPRALTAHEYALLLSNTGRMFALLSVIELPVATIWPRFETTD